MAESTNLLVQYSSSEAGSDDEDDSYGNEKTKEKTARCFTDKRASSADDKDLKPTKKLRLLPSVPSNIVSMFQDGGEDDHEDDPSAHQGRVRSFEHERGNWATYVYIPVPQENEFEDLASELSELLDEWEFHKVDHFHVSVSRTVVIRHHWIDPLSEALRDSLGNMHRFVCSFGALKFYCNDEKTRTFLSLQVEQPQDQLTDAVHIVDTCLQQFKLPKYYQPPSFHISLLWANGDVMSAVSEDVIQQLQDHVSEFISVHLKENYLDVREFQCKTGNKMFKFPLKGSPF